MSTKGHLGLLFCLVERLCGELVFGYSRLWLIGCTNSRLDNSLFVWPTVFLINQGDDQRSKGVQQWIQWKEKS